MNSFRKIYSNLLNNDKLKLILKNNVKKMINIKERLLQRQGSPMKYASIRYMIWRSDANRKDVQRGLAAPGVISTRYVIGRGECAVTAAVTGV